MNKSLILMFNLRRNKVYRPGSASQVEDAGFDSQGGHRNLILWYGYRFFSNLLIGKYLCASKQKKSIFENKL